MKQHGVGRSPKPLREVRAEPVPAPSRPSNSQTPLSGPCPVPVSPGAEPGAGGALPKPPPGMLPGRARLRGAACLQHLLPKLPLCPDVPGQLPAALVTSRLGCQLSPRCPAGQVPAGSALARCAGQSPPSRTLCVHPPAPGPRVGQLRPVFPVCFPHLCSSPPASSPSRSQEQLEDGTAATQLCAAIQLPVPWGRQRPAPPRGWGQASSSRWLWAW